MTFILNTISYHRPHNWASFSAKSEASKKLKGFYEFEFQSGSNAVIVLHLLSSHTRRHFSHSLMEYSSCSHMELDVNEHHPNGRKVPVPVP